MNGATMGMKKLLADLEVEPRGIVYAGAHHGEYVEELLGCGFAHLLLVEPSAESFTRLRALESERVRCVNAALDETSGPVTYFAAPGRLDILSSIFEPNPSHFAAIAARTQTDLVFERREAQGITLDALVGAPSSPPYNVLYMNIQGAELAAVKGARDSLAGFDVIACEVDFVPRYRNGVLYDDLRAYLESRGFTAAGLWRSNDPDNDYGTACFVRNERAAARDSSAAPHCSLQPCP